MGRQNHAIILIGRKHTGKSTKINEIAGNYPEDKRRLIIDVNQSPAYASVPRIVNYKQLSGWKKGLYKFYDSDNERMFNNLLSIFNPRIKKFNGLLVFEDCTKYIPANPPKKIKSFLVDHRMWDADLLFTFHSFKSVPPFFWTMCSYLIICKTQDNFQKNERLYESKIPNWDEVYKAIKSVQKSGNEFVSKTVDLLI